MSQEPVEINVTRCIRTLRLKVKGEAYGWLNAAAVEVNQVWNFANATSDRAARPFSGPAKWLSAYDLDKLTAGATECFERIGSDTIQRVNAEYATRRKQFKKVRLRWRVSRGSRRSLGWIPFKAAQLKRKGKSLRLSGKAFRIFERDRLEGVQWKSGCFAQDAVGDWWLCVAVGLPIAPVQARDEAVGLDLGLKNGGHDERWGETGGGRVLPQHRVKDRPGPAPRPQAPGKAAASYGGAAAKECLASVFEENRRSVSNDRRGRCERTEACQDAYGQIRAGLRLGYAQGAVAVQRPAGRQMRSNRQRKIHYASVQRLWSPHGPHRSGHACCKDVDVQRVW